MVKLSHIRCGNWDKTKYIIITPFDKVDKTSFGGGVAVDLYTDGSFYIPEGSYILCPQNESDLVKKMNPELKVVGYEGECSLGYGNLFIQLLGYKKEEICDKYWNNPKDDKKFHEILNELGIPDVLHFYSKESERDTSLTDMNAVCEILKTVNDQNLIVDAKTYGEVNEEIAQRIAPNGTHSSFYIINMLDVFFEKLERQSGIIISDEMKSKIRKSKEKIEMESKDSYSRTSVINENGEEIETLDTNYNIARKSLCKEIVDCCLYPKKQEIMMDEWILKYKELKELNSNQLNDTAEKFEELSKMLPTEIFEDEMLMEIFLTKTLSNNIEINVDTINLARNILNGNLDFKEDNFLRNMYLYKKCSLKEMSSRILSKELENKIIHEKTLDNLSFGEKEYIRCEIKTMDVVGSEAYQIFISHNDFEKSPVVIEDCSFGEFSERIKAMPFVIIDEEDEFYFLPTQYKTSFLPIQEKETISDYFERLGECVSLIDRYIRGEDIEFNEFGQSVETIRKAIQTEKIDSNNKSIEEQKVGIKNLVAQDPTVLLDKDYMEAIASVIEKGKKIERNEIGE